MNAPVSTTDTPDWTRYVAGAIVETFADATLVAGARTPSSTSMGRSPPSRPPTSASTPPAPPSPAPRSTPPASA
ncbi:hypothetical protein ACFQY5_05240 [Paeniroseomonas aquatica]|uniref:hypothetical protein n=1 Tax=Paeniroseomonas aquatica TaxID=373043 RepID=UPI00360A5E41